MNVFAYLRVSGKGQLEGDGFDRQRDTIQAFCQMKGWRVIRWFEEKGVSGTNEMGDRPALTELVSLLGPATTDTMVVECADRLARDLMVSELILSDVRKLNAKVYDASSQMDLTVSGDPTRVLIRQVLGAVSQWDKSMLVKKLRAARDRRSKDAGRRIEGPKPYELRGAEPAAVCQAILKLRGWGRSFSEIAAYLNRKKVVTPDGKRYWGKSTVYAIYERNSSGLRDVPAIRATEEVVDTVLNILPERSL